MKHFLIKCSITILAFLGSMAFAFAFIYPIFGLLFAADCIGYWSFLLCPIFLSLGASLICLISIYTAKKHDECCS